MLGIWQIIVSFFRWVGVRNILLVILGLALFSIVRGRLKVDEEARMPITSLFKKVEYVEELKLVTFYYEEIVAIGTSERLQALVFAAEDEVDNARRELINAEFNRDNARTALEVAIRKHEATDTTLSRIELEYSAARDSFEKYDFRNYRLFGNLREKKEAGKIERKPVEKDFKRIRKIMEEDDTVFGSKARFHYRVWVNANRPGNVGQNPQIIALVKLLNEKRDSFMKERDEAKVVLSKMEDEMSKTRRKYKRQLNEATRDYRSAEDAVEKAELSLKNKKEELVEAQQELDGLEGEPLPSLLFVVSAEVSGKVDLAQLDYEIETQDSLTIKRMPVPYPDSVNIRMSETKRFLTEGTDFRLTQAEEGLYYKVYQQIKDALEETKGVVLKKALETGLMEETEEMALDYVRDVARSMGYRIGFPASGLSDDQERNILVVENDSIDEITSQVVQKLDSIQKESQEGEAIDGE
ncbi:MAG: DUF4230 domain-containing protein [Bacteroidota bacterium]